MVHNKKKSLFFYDLESQKIPSLEDQQLFGNNMFILEQSKWKQEKFHINQPKR